jgi:hypothetical protein
MELRKFHRSYGHASVDKIISALEEAGYEDLPPGTREKLADITRRCEPFQRTATKPIHFSISLNWQGARFNHVIQVDVVHFTDGAVVHVIDSATGFNAARFTKSLLNPSGSEIWDAVKSGRMNFYVGPPDILQVDRGTNFNSNFIQTGCAMLGIEFQAIPTEAPWRIGKVERGHVALKVAYEKLREDLPDVDRDTLLSMDVKALNDSVGPSGISPTFAVFGTAARHFPALHKDHAVTHADRVRALEAARRAVEKYNASQSIKSAGKHTGPVPGERKLAVCMDIITYRKKVRWTGLFKLTGLTTTDAEVVDKNGEIIVLEQTRVKEFHHPTKDDVDFLQTYQWLNRGADSEDQHENLPAPAVGVQYDAETLLFIASVNSSSHGSGFANSACEDNFVVLHPDETENVITLETRVSQTLPRMLSASRQAARKR